MTTGIKPSWTSTIPWCPGTYLNVVRLKAGEEYTSSVPGYETVYVPSGSTARITGRDSGVNFCIAGGRTIVLDKGCHPVVAAPGYRMYYFTILVGKNTRTLIQNFEEKHAYQLKTIPGIADMIKTFKAS